MARVKVYKLWHGWIVSLRALALTQQEPERQFLQKRIWQLK